MSYRRPSQGYSEEFQKRWQADVAAEKAEQDQRERQETVARAAHRAKLDAEQQARQAQAEAALDAELEPTRLRELRSWLAAHPVKDEADFMRQAWPHLKLNALDERDTLRLENEILAQRNSGRYSL